MSKARCSTCRWFQESDGTCRALPPSPTSTAYKGRVPPRRPIWPRVEATDWCSRWRKRKPTKKVAAFLIKSNGSISGAADLAQQTRAGERVVSALKAAVPALTLSGSSAGDFGVLSAAFVQSLTSQGAFDAVRAGGSLQLPLDNLTFRAASSAMTGSTQSEGAWRPITRLETNAGLMTRVWATSITILSDEFLRFAPNALRLLEAELRKAAIAAVDRAFLAAMASGAATVPGSPSMLDDINVAADLMELDSSARLVLLAPADDVRRAALSADSDGRRRYPELATRGGEIGGVRVVPSDNIPASGSPAMGTGLLIDATQVATGSGEFEMDASRNAALQMSDTPAAGAQPLVSMFQTNATALRVQRQVAYSKLRSTAAVIIQSSIEW